MSGPSNSSHNSSQHEGSVTWGAPFSERVSSGQTIVDETSIEEHGRTFHAYRAGKYLLPNDGTEQDRLDVQHHLFRLLMDDKLVWAPIGDGPKSVLDIGTGTGIWALQYAQQNPTSTVIGSDLSLIQPTEACPPNCSFVREDTEEDWVYDTPFDYVHLRMMFSCFMKPKDMIAKIFANLRPGGWVEYQDFGLERILAEETPEQQELNRNDPLMEFMQLFIKGAASAKMFGRDIKIAHKYKAWLLEAGFVDVVEHQILCPVNGWPVDPRERFLGNWAAMDSLSFLESAAKIMVLAGMAEKDVPPFLARCRESMLSNAVHAYFPVYIVYGRKPHDWEHRLADGLPTQDEHRGM